MAELTDAEIDRALVRGKRSRDMSLAPPPRTLSPAKLAAARANGKKGGRPRKPRG